MSYAIDNLATAVTRLLQEFSNGSKSIEITERNGTKTIKVVSK